MPKKFLSFTFFLIVIYSLIALNPIAKDGGPCNGGVVYVVLGPLIIIISLIQFIIFRTALNRQKKISWIGPVFSVLCLSIWSYFTTAFATDDIADALLYLFPFLLLNLSVVVLAVRKKIRRT